MKIPGLKDRQIYLLQSEIEELKEELNNKLLAIDDLRIYACGLETENKQLKERIQTILEQKV